MRQYGVIDVRAALAEIKLKYYRKATVINIWRRATTIFKYFQ